jgi:hypothetical protein
VISDRQNKVKEDKSYVSAPSGFNGDDQNGKIQFSSNAY